MTSDPQMLKGLVSMLVLRLLEEREDYGYSVVVRLRANGFGELGEGTVYPALARAEQAGWIESRLVASEKGPARKYYSLTDSGRVERDRAQAAWERLSALVAHFDPAATPSIKEK